MLDEYYADNELYFEFMELSKEDIPLKNQGPNKQELFKLVEAQFRKLARKYHPDFGGNENDFKKLLHCKKKLTETDVESKSLTLFFDENKYAAYDSDTLASKLGNQLYELICSWQDELNLEPIKKPSSQMDGYEWVFNLKENNAKLSLNVLNLNDDLAELSNELYQDDGLSVLVCLFVPSMKLNTTKIAYDNSTLLTFNDLNLIESSNAKDIADYFSSHENIINDLEKIENGTFVSKTNKELKTKTPEEAKDKDRKMLEYLHKMKIFSTDFDEKAADFIDKL